MSILVYANTAKNKVHKSAFEAVSYGAQIAEKSGDSVTAVVVGNADDLDTLGKYGADKVIHVTNDKLNDFQPTLIAQAIQQAAEENNASIIVFSHDLSGKSVAPILAAKMNAGIVTGAVDLPQMDGDFIVKKAVFSGKAYAHVKVTTATKIISLTPNALEKKEYNKTKSKIEKYTEEWE